MHPILQDHLLFVAWLCCESHKSLIQEGFDTVYLSLCEVREFSQAVKINTFGLTAFSLDRTGVKNCNLKSSEVRCKVKQW